MPDVTVQGEARRVEPQVMPRQVGLEIAGEMDDHLVHVADHQGASGEGQGCKLTLVMSEINGSSRKFAADLADAFGLQAMFFGKDQEQD
jgi:hypothetical protein